MIAVRRPVRALSGFSSNNDDRIQGPPEFVHRCGKALDVRLGEIALIWGGLDQIDRQRGEDLPVAAERILVGREDCPSVGLDRFGESGQSRRLCAGCDRVRRDAARAGLGGRLLLPARLLRRLRLGHWTSSWTAELPLVVKPCNSVGEGVYCG